ADPVKSVAKRWKQLLAGSGEPDRTGTADEQLTTEKVLQVPDLVTDSRWSDMQFLGGCLEAPVPGGGFKGPEGVERRQVAHVYFQMNFPHLNANKSPFAKGA